MQKYKTYQIGTTLFVLLFLLVSCSSPNMHEQAEQPYLVAIFYDPLMVEDGSNDQAVVQKAINDLCALLEESGGVLYLCEVTPEIRPTRSIDTRPLVKSHAAFFWPEERLIGIALNVDSQLIRNFFNVPATIVDSINEAIVHIQAGG